MTFSFLLKVFENKSFLILGSSTTQSLKWVSKLGSIEADFFSARTMRKQMVRELFIPARKEIAPPNKFTYGQGITTA